ncbi:MAG TPA: SLATT domain-containing protein [Terriglobales bacterium]|jgi:hypothetical protein|nr:SLATT domain-containing protein [Terriglobales bacterium]
MARDIQFKILENLEWGKGNVGNSLDKIATLALDHADAAVGWYLRRKVWKRRCARATRFSAILLVLASGLVPLFGEIFAADGKPNVNPLWASVALVLAAGAVGIDRFFGFSTAYMRYLSASMKLQRIVQDFSFEWQARRALTGDAEQTSIQVQEGINACKKLLADVDQTIQAETETWLQEFTTALAEIDKSAHTQAETARGGAVNLTITNGDSFPDGWQLAIDGGSPEQRNGKSAAVRGLIAGTHLISVRGQVNGITKVAERNVILAAGAVAEVALTLD